MRLSNEGEWDRVVRIVAGVALEYAAWVTWPVSVMARPATIGAALLLMAAGAIALITGLSGWCPMYTVLGISTKRRTRG